MATLADTVRIAPRFTRSIQVEADLLARSALDGFVCSASSAALLRGLARQYADGRQSAFTVTGTYGSGKSSLAVALASLVGCDPAGRAAARSVLGPDLADEVTAALRVQKGYSIVPVAGRRGEADAIIDASLARQSHGLPRRKRSVEATSLSDRLTAAAQRPEADGLLLIIDEMGKLLEASASGEGDVHVLQEIAEAAARSNGRLLVVGLLHSAFDDYAGRLGVTARREWLKVQGRFADLPLQIGLEEQVDILARAIEAPWRPQENMRACRAMAAEVCRSRPEAAEAFASRLHECWPLEPLAAVLLSAMARRGLGQSQRSLFAFLTSAEPRGFREVLANRTEEDKRGYAASDLWDYLAANRGVAQIGATEASRFALGLDAIDRCLARGGGLDHLEVLKSVAMLDLFREVVGARATPSLLETQGAGHARPADGVLTELVAWSVLVHRRHVDAYALFAGSDLDVDSLVTAARARVAGVDIKRLNALAAIPPFVAKRHHEETGALRWFPVEIVALADASTRVSQAEAATDAAGLFLLTLPLAGETPRVARRLWRAAADQPATSPVALGLPRDAFLIRELAEDLLALELVRTETPELAGDAAARREVAARHAAAAAELEVALRGSAAGAEWLALIPGEPVSTLVAGTPSALTAAASWLADSAFPSAPKLRNDLLNRAEPSVNAVAARRALLHAMVSGAARANLGLEGFPPERGLHASILQHTGLHAAGPDGDVWRFVEPATADMSRLQPLWAATDSALKEEKGGHTVETIYAMWSAPPFGVRAGLLPVLTMAYLLSRRDTVAVSLDGAFVPAPSTFLVDRLLQEPSAVSLRWSEATGARNAWFTAVSAALATFQSSTGASDQVEVLSALDVARSLYAFVADLPPWALKTSRVGPMAQKLRNIVRRATDPLILLLDQVPALLGGELVTVEDAQRMTASLTTELEVLRTAYPRLLTELADTVSREFRIFGEGGVTTLPERARAIRGVTGDLRLDALTVHLEGYDASRGQVEAITALASHKAPRDWTDRDIDAAKLGIAELAQAFLRAEAMAHVKGRSDTAEIMAIVTSAPGAPGPLLVEVRIPRASETEANALQAGVERLLKRNGSPFETRVAALARALSQLMAENASSNEEREAE